MDTNELRKLTWLLQFSLRRDEADSGSSPMELWFGTSARQLQLAL
jgi:hypothetical protein